MTTPGKIPAIRIIIFWLLLSCITAGIYYYFNKTRFVRYPGFGIDMPVNYSIHGIDVSHYQFAIDWEEVKAMQIKNINIGFCFIKATEGTTGIDSKFKNNWQGAKENKLVRGAYHFFNPERNGMQQAQNFIDNVSLEKGDLPPVVDIEQINDADINELQQRLKEWLTVIEAHYHVKPIIYTNTGFYKNYLAVKFDGYPLWVAHYLIKDKPRIDRNWLFWQHNESGNVNGIDSYVDFNVFNGDSTDFKKLLLK